MSWTRDITSCHTFEWIHAWYSILYTKCVNGRATKYDLFMFKHAEKGSKENRNYQIVIIHDLFIVLEHALKKIDN